MEGPGLEERSGPGAEYGHTGPAGAAERPDGRPAAALPDGLLLRAAADGRTDVLGPAGLLRLQRTAGNAGAVAAVQHAAVQRAAVQRAAVHDVVASGGGRPLDPEVRTDMEARLGHDFGDVRVHTDATADESAQAVDAHAYTAGSHVVFRQGAYDPGSHQGRTTLAHELTHVVQQRSGPVDGTETPDGLKVSDPSDRFEREAVATADRAMATPPPSPVQRTPTTDPPASTDGP
ncbi:eCIS core domain-containing protein [Streptomyces bambusae]|uniref:DUF4157 domain-containing protein n=1 Tax=Streptomyces bambusae TaxID=1550616 RepID=A0ABS6Z8V0_9ACTN|nr:DUF4157 domain-containing protein [Streptomyces bambusae]MBW5484167.1 DUF4157 domain-containing protein [Streptomyces bambusae]